MTHPNDRNPFDRFDLDPASDVASITDALRERAEDAPDDATRREIRAAWEALTLHPERRLALAMTAVPESRAPVGQPPRGPLLPPGRTGAGGTGAGGTGAGGTGDSAERLGLLDLVGLPSLASELDRTLGPEDDAERALWAPRPSIARRRDPTR